MDRFVVWLDNSDVSDLDCWVFCTCRSASFPDDFQAFDTSSIKNSAVVWVADTTQALVAYDWLIERGWEYDARSCSNDEFTDLLTRCGAL